MLNKNLLLGCIIAALTACGGGQGSLDLGPNNPDFGKEPPPVTEEPPEEITYTWDFEDEAQVADWETGSALAVPDGGQGNDCDLDTTISKHFQSSALQITPVTGWSADFEDMCAMGYVSTPLAMQGGKIQLSVYLPSFYTNQNPWNAEADPSNLEDDRFNFGLQILLEDASGNRADAAAWTNVYDLLGKSFNANGIGFQQREPDPTTGEVAGRWFDLSFSADGYVGADSAFDINSLVGVGIRLVLRDTNITLPWEDNAQYVFIDNVVLAMPDGSYIPPIPAQPAAQFALPIYNDGSLKSGFNDWGGFKGDYRSAESYELAFFGADVEGGYGAAQWGGPSPAIDASEYSTFHFSAYGAPGSGETTVRVSLCDCETDEDVLITVVEGEWTDFTFQVSDFTDTTMDAIRFRLWQDEAATIYIDNVGFDKVEDACLVTMCFSLDGGDFETDNGSGSFEMGDGVLAVTPDWTGVADEKYAVRSIIPERTPVDLMGGDLSVDFNIPTAYFDDGNLVVQVFVFDSQWRYASLGWVDVNTTNFTAGGDAWSRLTYQNIQESDFGYMADNFDLSDVTRIGFEFIAKAGLEAEGTILIDNISLPKCTVCFDGDDSAFEIDNGAGSFAVENSALVVTPEWTGAADEKFSVRSVLPYPVDLTGNQISVDFNFPTAYFDDGNLVVQMFVFDSEWRYASLGWVDVNTTNFTAGGDTWSTLTYANIQASSFGYMADDFDITDVVRIGFEIIGRTGLAADGAVLIDNIFLPPQACDICFDGDDSAFEFDNGIEGSFVIENSALVVTPVWTGTADEKYALRSILPEVVNLEGNAFSVDLNIPTTYFDDGNLVIQVYFFDSQWRYASMGWTDVNATNFPAGGDAWSTLTYTDIQESSFGYAADGFDITDVARIGFEIIGKSGLTADGSLRIDNIILP